MTQLKSLSQSLRLQSKSVPIATTKAVRLLTTLSLLFFTSFSGAITKNFNPLSLSLNIPNNKCLNNLSNSSPANQDHSEPNVLYNSRIRNHVKNFLIRQIEQKYELAHKTDNSIKDKPAQSVLSDTESFTKKKSLVDKIMSILDNDSAFKMSDKSLNLNVLNQIRDLLEDDFPESLVSRPLRVTTRLRRRITDLADFFRSHHLDDEPQVKDHSAVYLDIGAGSGQIASGISKELGIKSKNTYALELAQYPNSATDVVWINYDHQGHIPLASESVDIITVMMVFHHAPDPRHLLSEIDRVLKPGGTVIIRETDASNQAYLNLNSEEMISLNQILDNMLYVVFDPNSGVPMVNNYRPKDFWNQLFKEFNFKVEESQTKEIGSPFQPMYFILKK